MRALILAALFLGAVTFAQDYDAEQRAEMQRQQAFRDGMAAIVDGLNEQSLDNFKRAIDPDDMLERIMGLRLIDRRVQQNVAENFDARLPDMIDAVFADADGNIRAQLLSVESRGDRGRALVRYDLPKMQFSYHEYDLRYDEARDRIIILDWIDFLDGQRFSDRNGEQLVAQAPTKPAVRKLVEDQRLSESQIFQVTELLKATRDRRVDRFLQIIESMDPTLAAERSVLLLHVRFMRAMRKRRNYVNALAEMAKHYPDDPLFSLMLLDYYFPSRRYEEALEALRSLETRLGVEDSAMRARLSAAALVTGDVAAATEYGEQAVAMEPGLELGWWSLFRAAVAAGDFSRAIAAMTKLEDEFGYTLNREALVRDRSLASLLASDDYRDWSAGRHSDGAN